MATNVTKILQLDPGPRPYANESIDELFNELVRDVDSSANLLAFARGLYAETNTNKIDASVVMAFVDAARLPMFNVVDALGPIIHELKQREAERRAS